MNKLHRLNKEKKKKSNQKKQDKVFDYERKLNNIKKIRKKGQKEIIFH